MKNALILHGTYGSSQENWFPWLKNKLEELGYQVWVPDLPQANQPDYKRYNPFIFDNFDLNKETLLIGHSSGAVAILRLLEDLPKGQVVNKAILVGGFVNNLDWDDLKGMFDKEFNWDKIKASVKKIVLIHSDDDPYIDMKHGEMLKENLSGQLVIMKGQKHFNTGTMGDRYKEFPEILKLL